jgi:hypothetical protein
MHWRRRRDLEGGKELGVWLLLEGDTLEKELYVESHEYRGGGFDVYTASPDGEWEHEGTFETVENAFDTALAYIDETGFPIEGG